jgi:hypothetical protein
VDAREEASRHLYSLFLPTTRETLGGTLRGSITMVVVQHLPTHGSATVADSNRGDTIGHLAKCARFV